MADKNTLDLARQWAADIDADRQTLSQDTIDASVEVIRDLPDEWVDADDVRRFVADWRDGLTTAPRGNYEAEMLDDLEDMLPAPPAPRTMDEIEWDDEHQGLEAVYLAGTGWESVVRMLCPMERNGDDGIVCVEKSGRVFYPYPRDLTPLPGTKVNLTPTGRKYRLEPEDDTPTSPIEDKPAPDLPAPTSHRGDGQPEWLVAGLAKIYVDWGLVVFELENPDDEELTNEGAKRLALALLAASDHAQKDNNHDQ